MKLARANSEDTPSVAKKSPKPVAQLRKENAEALREKVNLHYP